MSKEVEKLKEEIRAALQELSEQEIFFLTEIGARVDSPSQAVRRVSPIVHLNSKEEEIVRKVAKLKKMVRDKGQGADFSEVLEKIRNRRFIMDKEISLEEKIKKLREKMRLNNKAVKQRIREKENIEREKKRKEEEKKIKKFILSVIERFEQTIQSYNWKLGNITVSEFSEEFNEDLLYDGASCQEVVAILEEIGFSVEHINFPKGCIRVTLYEKPKKRTGPGSSI